MATNFVALKLTSGAIVLGNRDVRTRIERFLFTGPNSETRPFRQQAVDKGLARDMAARRIFAAFLSKPHPGIPDKVQKSWFLAAMSVWIDGDPRRDVENDAPARRRAADGIPSAEALLEWFAENESFCESVRADATARLEDLKKKSEPVSDAHPVGEAAAFPATGDGDEKEMNSP